jgi:hydroxymethylpyrimidine/phosphomethylpyrimidine kinase
MIPRILTIAGSDSGGGAGIQADLKTILARGGYGMSAITALTAQYTVGVRDVLSVPPQFVAAQIDAVVEDIGADAAKTGMLADRGIVECVAERVRHHGIRPLVVDPVMVAKSGDRLLSPDAVEAVRRGLLPLATVLTPNLPEAEALTGRSVGNAEEARDAARRIHEMGPEWVLVKGGHLPGEAVDLLFDGRRFIEIVRPRVDTKNTHGTGCTYSAAIAVELGKGLEVPEAVERARDALQAALRGALPLGSGAGPLDHGRMHQPPKKT